MNRDAASSFKCCSSYRGNGHTIGGDLTTFIPSQHGALKQPGQDIGHTQVYKPPREISFDFLV